jgi:hypothetical protein
VPPNLPILVPLRGHTISVAATSFACLLLLVIAIDAGLESYYLHPASTSTVVDYPHPSTSICLCYLVVQTTSVEFHFIIVLAKANAQLSVWSFQNALLTHSF